MKAPALLLLLAELLLPLSVRSEERFSMKGLERTDYKQLEVQVGWLPAAARRIGLTEAMVRKEIERRLRAAGIKPAEDRKGLEFLAVDINAYEAAFSLRIALQRPVTYEARRDVVHSIGSVYARDTVGLHSNDPSQVLKSLDSLLDMFLNDYFEANPK